MCHLIENFTKISPTTYFFPFSALFFMSPLEDYNTVRVCEYHLKKEENFAGGNFCEKKTVFSNPARVKGSFARGSFCESAILQKMINVLRLEKSNFYAE